MLYSSVAKFKQGSFILSSMPLQSLLGKILFPFFFFLIDYCSRECCSQHSVVCLFNPFLWLILDTEKNH